MNIRNKHIMIACCYEAEYGGNFIKMLYALAKRLEDEYETKVFFAFPEQSEKVWLTELSSKFTVGYTCKPYSKSISDLYKLIATWQIDLVYTHFEGYDIPVAKAIRMTGRQIKMVWHLHDYISFDKTGLRLKFLRKVGTNLRLWLQYGWYGRNAYFVGVSAEVTNIACHYRNHFFSFPKLYSNVELQGLDFPRASVVLNGIDMSRLGEGYVPQSDKFSFISFGGESYSKGIPCILDAAHELSKQGYDFTFILTRGYTTSQLLDERYKGKLPKWLRVVEQTDNICKLFNQANCYISASLRETMSMGIAEASLFGLPIIQSDIPGTWWNTDTPSAFLFKLNDANDLVAKMKMVMDMPREEMKYLCSKSQEINNERLSMEKWSNKLIEILNII